MIIGFYQLLTRPVEAVLPQLVVKALEAGHRLLVRSDDAALLARLDALLWEFAPASFVPHGRVDALAPERLASQPVLLGAEWPAANGADFLMQIGDDLPDALYGLKRAAFLFGENELETARARWRTVKALAGMEPAYWREGSGGRFEKVA